LQGQVLLEMIIQVVVVEVDLENLQGLLLVVTLQVH
jgi:hypothetical protein|tara:strand:+ start:31 stop:138 length:108 start_codon:yes stop_codon:yes gene_type:complete